MLRELVMKCRLYLDSNAWRAQRLYQSYFVDPAYQCKSIGSKMLGMIEKRIFRESPNVFIFVTNTNIRRSSSMKRLGYQQVGIFSDFNVNGCDEILLRKSIGP